MPRIQDNTSHPTVKLPEIGSSIVLAIGHVKRMPQNDFVTGEQKISTRGNPMTQDLIIGVVMDYNGSLVSENDVTREPKKGETVNLWCGSRTMSWVKAKRKLGPLDTGDVVKVTFAETKPTDRGSPQKIWSFQLRKSREDEVTLRQKCDEIFYAEQKTRDDGRPDPGDNGDEEPPTPEEHYADKPEAQPDF